jgi:hypothetical protein
MQASYKKGDCAKTLHEAVYFIHKDQERTPQAIALQKCVFFTQ